MSVGCGSVERMFEESGVRVSDGVTDAVTDAVTDGVTDAVTDGGAGKRVTGGSAADGCAPDGTLDSGVMVMPGGLEEMAPGADLAALVGSLEVGRLSGYDRVVLLRAHQRLVSHYQAKLYEDMVWITDALCAEDTRRQAMTANEAWEPFPDDTDTGTVTSADGDTPAASGDGHVAGGAGDDRCRDRDGDNDFTGTPGDGLGGGDGCVVRGGDRGEDAAGTAGDAASGTVPAAPSGQRESAGWWVAVEATCAEVRAALCLTRRSADMEMGWAVALVLRLPRVWEALLAGVIDWRRTRVLLDGTGHLPETTARAVVDQVIEVAGRLTTGQLAARVRRLCLEIDPDAATQWYRHTVAERRVVTAATPEGTAHLLGLDLPPHQAQAAMRRLTHLARGLKRAGEDRSLDQLRADVYLDLLTATSVPGTGPHRRRRNSGRSGSSDAARSGGSGGGGGVVGGGVEIRVDLETLVGLAERPGELAGFGPVIADIARQITAQHTGAQWRYVVTDPDSGQPRHVGVTRRRPSTQQRRFVEARDRRCVFPGCRMPATGCDIDHTDTWLRTGVTRVDKLAPLCPHDHHTVRHRHHWTYRRLQNGDHHWTSPLGHTYLTPREPP